MIDYGYGVSLAPLKESNLELYRTWRNSDIRFSFRQTGLLSEADHLAWWEILKKNPSIKMFEVIYQTKCIGVCGLTSIDFINRRAEISSYIGGDFDKEKEAVLTLCAFGFLELGLNRIWAEVMEFSDKTKLFETLCFDLEGKRHEHYFKCGRFFNSYLYSVSNREFISSFKPKTTI